MDCQTFNDDSCRICLERNAKEDWNHNLRGHCNLTYKDCFYKYTGLECYDVNNSYLPTVICRSCLTSLENINAFVSKAIEIQNLLNESLAVNTKIKDEDGGKFETIIIAKPDDEPNVSNQDGSDDECHALKSSNVEREEIAEVLNINTKIKEENDFLETNFETVVISETKTYDSSEENEIERIFWNGSPTSKSPENSTTALQNNEKVTKKKHSSKPWEIPTVCTICSKVLSSKYKAIAHEKTHQKNRERKETCSKCGLKFYNKSSLTFHMKTHIENREKKHKCEFCDKAFYNCGGLNLHRKIHLGQMINCTLCEKQFYRQIDLERHMPSHSASKVSADCKPQKKYYVCCVTCGENVRSAEYKSHNARHKNEPLVKCAICNREYFSRSSCNKHLRKVHKKENGERTKCWYSFHKRLKRITSARVGCDRNIKTLIKHITFKQQPKIF